MRLTLLVLGLLIMAVIAGGFKSTGTNDDFVWCNKQGRMVHASECPCRRRV